MVQTKFYEQLCVSLFSFAAPLIDVATVTYTGGTLKITIFESVNDVTKK